MTISNILRMLSLGTIVLCTNIWCMEDNTLRALKLETEGEKWWYRTMNKLIAIRQEEARKKQSAPRPQHTSHQQAK